MPSMLLVYDAQQDIAYWLYLQAYFEAMVNFDLSRVGATVTVNISKKNIVNSEAIAKFARYKEKIVRQIQGVIRHDD